jgi:8-oxo-dGTP diphosphatase
MNSGNAKPVILVAAVALIDPDGRVLIAQRPEGRTMAGLWEFPGGKLEDGESPEAALIRELQEELGITVQEPCLAPYTFASHAYADFHLLMPLYLCRRWEGIAVPKEHAAIRWIRPRELMAEPARYPMPAADLPLLPMLRDLL